MPAARRIVVVRVCHKKLLYYKINSDERIIAIMVETTQIQMIITTFSVVITYRPRQPSPASQRFPDQAMLATRLPVPPIPFQPPRVLAAAVAAAP